MKLLSKKLTDEFDFVNRYCPFEGKPFVGIAGQGSGRASAELDLGGSAVDGGANEEVVEKQKAALLRPRHESGTVELELRHVVFAQQKSVAGLN